jgi:cytochrome c-type biogenesis protein
MQESSASVGILIAFTAGLLSFLSPCVLPLIPSYVTFITGMSLEDVQRSRRIAVVHSLLFILGFTLVFLALGATATALGRVIFVHRDWVGRAGGVLVIVLGLAFMGAFPFLQRDWRIHRVPAVGLAAAPFLGFLFGVGWTPCVGPTLGVIQTLAANEATASRGALLSAVYALGLGIPFVLAALAYRRALAAFAVIRRHQQWVMRIGGLMLVGVGVLLLFVITMLSAAGGFFFAWVFDHDIPLGLTWGFLVMTGVWLLLVLVIALVGVRSLKKVKAPQKTIATVQEIPAALKGKPDPRVTIDLPEAPRSASADTGASGRHVSS